MNSPNRAATGTTRRTLEDLDEVDRVGFDPTTESFHVRYDDGDDAAIVCAVVETVAAVRDENPEDLSPLYDALPADSLVDLLTAPRDTDVEVAFTYEECPVVVSNRGEVVVRQPA